MNLNKLYTSFKGKGLIVFSDPSAAKSCLAFAKICNFLSLNCTFQILTNKSYSFYEEWDLNIEIIDGIQEISFDGIDWVFSGTSHPDSSLCFEVSIIKLSKLYKIKTYGYVDQWKNVNQRFLYENDLFYTDFIFVPDLFSKNKLVDQKIDVEKIQVLKNPYLTYIENFWQIKKSKQEIELILNISLEKKKIIVYAPDPFTLRGQDLVFGFDEFSVFKELIDLLKIKKDYFLIVKLHPLQPKKKQFLELAQNHKDIYIDLNNELDNLDICFYSNYVLGFYSNFLLEANQINNSVIRYFPNNNRLDILGYLDFGNKICSYEDLVMAIT